MTCKQLRPFIVDFACGAIDAAAVEAQIARHVRACQPCRAFLERERIMSAALRRLACAAEVPPIAQERERLLIGAFDDLAKKPKTGHVWSRVGAPALAAALLLTVMVVSWRVLSRPPVDRVTTAEGTAATAQRRPSSPTPSATLSRPREEGVASPERRRPQVVRSPERRSRVDPWGPPSAFAEATADRRSLGGGWSGGPGDTSDLGDATLENVSFVTWPGAAAGPPLESGTLMRVDLPVSILPALGLWPPASAQTTVPVEILVGQDGFARAFRLVAE